MRLRSAGLQACASAPGHALSSRGRSPGEPYTYVCRSVEPRYRAAPARKRLLPRAVSRGIHRGTPRQKTSYSTPKVARKTGSSYTITNRWKPNQTTAPYSSSGPKLQARQAVKCHWISTYDMKSCISWQNVFQRCDCVLYSCGSGAHPSNFGLRRLILRQHSDS